MKHTQAIKLAVEAMEREIKALAVNANMHDMMGMDAPACIADSQRRKDLRAAIAALRPAPVKAATGDYSIIYLDPPWRYNSRANHKTRFRGGAEGHYPLMGMDEIAA